MPYQEVTFNLGVYRVGARYFDDELDARRYQLELEEAYVAGFKAGMEEVLKLASSLL